MSLGDGFVISLEIGVVSNVGRDRVAKIVIVTNVALEVGSEFLNYGYGVSFRGASLVGLKGGLDPGDHAFLG